MQVTTTSLSGAVRPKPFSFSYSKLKNYATCPKRYYLIDVAKEFKEAESEELRYGNELHKHLANRLGKKQQLPHGYEDFEQSMQRLEQVPGKCMVEQQLAIREDFTPCEWFAKDAWYRAIADVLIVDEPVAFANDYKTGKILEDSQQLALLAATVFSHYPNVHAIRTEFWWLKHDAISRADFKRRDMTGMWANIWPRIEELKHAHEKMLFPPKPSGLCKRHCVITSCPHHGVG